jgi:predicted alpha/beta superfamily hydrolase
LGDFLILYNSKWFQKSNRVGKETNASLKGLSHMKPYLKTIGLLSFLMLAQTLSACASQTPAKTPPPRVSIPCSEVRQIHSEATGRDYDLYIRLPNDYEKFPKVKYPVIYLLDAQWDFKMLDSIYGGLEYDGFIPEVIIVGITYTGEKADYNALRARDLTPVEDQSFPGSGDAPKFLTFIKSQLIPFIESNYQVNTSKRVLMGSSFGGTFTLYTLFTDPTLFTGYVAGSPVTVFGNRFAFDQEAAYAKIHQELPVRLYLAVGEVEDLKQPVQMFMDVLKERNYTGLKLETRILDGEGHSSNKPELYNRGLRFVLQN